MAEETSKKGCHVVIYFDALEQDKPPEGKGVLLGLLSRWIRDPEDTEARQEVKRSFPDLYYSMLEVEAKEAAEVQ